MTSPTGYYIRKFLYRGWNPYDQTVQQGYRCVHLLSWTQMCLIFAEAAREQRRMTSCSSCRSPPRLTALYTGLKNKFRKNKKAKELGVPIISEDDFLKMFK